MLKFMKSLEKAGGHMPHGQSATSPACDPLLCVFTLNNVIFFKT